jgi:hypothetical protein
VLRIRIREGKKSGSCIRDPGSATNVPDHISKSSVKIIWAKKMLKFLTADPDPESGAFFTLDPGWKISDPA